MMHLLPEKILLVHYGPYLKSLGGGAKADRFLLEYLAAKGYHCTAVVPASHSRFIAPPSDTLASPTSIVRKRVSGVDVHLIYERSKGDYFRLKGLLDHLSELIATSPKWIFVTGSDRGHQILKTAVNKSADRNVIFVARATAELPTGPSAIVHDEVALRAMSKTHSVLCASRYMAEYIRKWCRLDADPLEMPVYGSPPFSDMSGQGRYITMVNPCGIKGIDVFLELAKRHPQWSFAAVPTWGTTDQDLARLRKLANVAELPSSPDINVIFQETRILLVPSLWDEAFGMIVVEAMLRGIPVLAADIGGLAEAKLGVPYLVPVRLLTSYRGFDSAKRTPLANIPVQDVGPWSWALARLLDDPVHYPEISSISRQASMAYIARLSMRQIDEIVAQEPPAIGQIATRTLGWTEVSAVRRSALAARLRARQTRGV
jgi:glycosyltransferase involved in cell wall biosynthesis